MRTHCKLLLLTVALVLCILVFVSCDNSKTVVRVYVNDEMHAIAEYSDGSTEDLGYVGVEVEKEVEVTPPKYTVTFLDPFGAVLKTEKVYKGDAATAPEAPEITDKSFDGWDTAFDTVTGDLTVRPIYVAAAEYTVTFLDENGAIIKTETVVHGHAATAPTAPLRQDTVFKEWDSAFDNVKSNLTVRAVYRPKKTYTVTFLDYSGLPLGTATVKEMGMATAPVTPTRDGYTFAGWSSGLTNITSNKTVTAKYNLRGGSNVVDLAYTLNANGTVTLTASVKGTVKFAGLNGSVVIPNGATDAVVAGGEKTLANISGGVVYFVYGEATNAITETVLFTLTFRSTESTLAFVTTVDSISDADGATVAYDVVGQTIRLK